MNALRHFGPLLCVLLAGCGPEKPERTSGGVEVPVGTCGRGLSVLCSDYASVNVAMLGMDGSVLSSSFISSASADAALSAPLSGDTSLPTTLTSADQIVLIDRYPNSVLSWVDVLRARVTAQLSVATGYSANPHDYVELHAHKAYVSRFEPNLDHGREPFDAGSDVLIVDPSVPAISGRIDLSSAMSGVEPGYFPHPDALLLVGARLYVLLEGYTLDYSDSAPSRLVAIDTANDTIEGVLVFSGLHGCAGLAKHPDRDLLAVTCIGRPSDVADADESSGIALVELGPELRESKRFVAPEFGPSPFGFDVAFTTEDTLLVTTLGRFEDERAPARPDRLLWLDTNSGAAETALESHAAPFTFGAVRCAPACGVCFAADAGRGNGVVHAFTIAADGRVVHERAIEVDRDVGLPPRDLSWF